ncbi:NHL repeat-containing protein [Spirosoma fluviale]|uniref:NHL repeat-containing protein n=1 Tax=Spirosoma fluviale TaxID=1597977 RepID=A0A286G875_9BACT|nr:hypothetical protein [Spirosoma fluviale]SOD91750.1 hypothetical protein SAMN06269250_3621 [Spirosoma fluviale]
MRYILFFFAGLSLMARAQSPIPKLPSSPNAIVIDSKDNVIMHVYQGRVMKLTPDGKLSYITEDIRKDIKRAPYPRCNAMAIDAQDNIYMADEGLIWKLTLDGKVTLFAGVPFVSRVKDGPLQTAQFRSIEFIEIDQAGNIYVAERDNTNKDNLGDFYLIRKIDANGMVTTLVNTRESTTLKTKWIAGMGIDPAGNLYLSDGAGRCIKKLAVNGTVTTLAGLCGKREFHPVYVQGDVSKAELMAPQDILINSKGDVIFADGRLHRIIKIAENKVATIAGNSIIQPNNVNMGGRAQEGYKDGKALTALFNFPLGCDIAMDSKQNIYIIDGGNDCIRKLSADGMVTTIAK